MCCAACERVPTCFLAILSPPEYSMSLFESSNKVAFISGPIEQPDDYFPVHYEPQIQEAIAAGHSFILGPAPGTDTIALHYLLEHVKQPTSITVYLAKFQGEGTQAENVAYYKRLRVKLKVEGYDERSRCRNDEGLRL